jgi:hypothetical protein
MTILVGLLCQDGVVIGTDSSATFAHGAMPTIEQQTKKISIISDRVIVAGTGAIGLNQRFTAIAQQLSDNKVFGGMQQQSAVAIGKQLSADGIRDFSETGAKLGSYGALVAFPCGPKLYLCELAVIDFQPELKDSNVWYVSMGSGQPIVDPFLGFLRKVFWRDTPPRLNEGKFAVAWALQQAVDLNPGGIKDPICLAVLEYEKGKPAAHLLDDAEIQEHLNSVQAAEEYLARYTKLLSGEGAQKVPDV